MKKIKGVFDSDEEMFAAKDSLVAAYLAKGGKITYAKPHFVEEIKLDTVHPEDFSDHKDVI